MKTILIGEELYKKLEALIKVKVDEINWYVYYKDECTGEKWVKDYPNSEYHGGGPPRLTLIEAFPWEEEE